MTFRSQLEPSIKSYECFMFLQNFTSEITVDWWILEDLNCFFYQKPRKSKNALYYQKNIRFLSEIDQKVPIVVEKLKKWNLQKCPLEVK